MSTKAISVFINGSQVTVKKLDLGETLDSVRKKLADKISEANLFTLADGDKIDITDEGEWTLQDVLIDGKKINLTSISNQASTSISNQPSVPPKKNFPIQGAKLHGKEGNLDI